MHKRIPVILDTDIGGDIDDTWALAMMLRSPELDCKLVVTNTGDTIYRAKIAARLLEVTGRTDIPVGVGAWKNRGKELQGDWVEQYSLARYPGTVYYDGVEALIQTIMASAEPITLICIGPLTNIKDALEREPKIAERARFVGMHGCFRRSQGASEPIAEYNVKKDIAASQMVFAAPWRDPTITPLDTCAQVRLRGEKYAAVTRCADPLARAVIENYRLWLQGKPDTESSVLFDTVAVYLAFTDKLLDMQRMGVRVDETGRTVQDPQARLFNVALEWKNLATFEDLLVERLTGCKS
jgi:inosine-uridine nucleoside N-ribohydrolase